MKKIFFLLLIVIGFAGNVRAADETETLKSPVPLEQGQQGLIQLNSSSSRVGQLEQRINELERELRSQKDSLRDLERDVRDLRRRNNNF